MLTVELKWKLNKLKEVKMCYGMSFIEYFGVVMIFMECCKYYIGGKIEGLNIS